MLLASLSKRKISQNLCDAAGNKIRNKEIVITLQHCTRTLWKTAAGLKLRFRNAV
jgi:hypothetical protein